MFAAALKDCCREYDYSARMGGDEFVLVAPGLGGSAAEEMRQRLERIAADIGRTLCEDGTLSTSVGQSFYPQDGLDAERLLVGADRSMYNAKNSRSATLERSHHTVTPVVDKYAG